MARTASLIVALFIVLTTGYASALPRFKPLMKSLRSATVRLFVKTPAQKLASKVERAQDTLALLRSYARSDEHMMMAWAHVNQNYAGTLQLYSKLAGQVKDVEAFAKANKLPMPNLASLKKGAVEATAWHFSGSLEQRIKDDRRGRKGVKKALAEAKTLREVFARTLND
jgi:hypothetical protein